MSKSKKNFGLSLITSIVFVILGLFLFIKPNATITTISYIIGGILLILGIISIIRYFRSDFGINALAVFSKNPLFLRLYRILSFCHTCPYRNGLKCKNLYINK